MEFLAKSGGQIALAALACALCTLPAAAKTFVYVSNAEDGDISTYTLTKSDLLNSEATG